MKKFIIILILFFPFITNAFTLGVTTDIHAGGSSKATGSWGTIYPSRWEKYLTPLKNANPNYYLILGDNTSGSKTYAQKLKVFLPERVLWVKGNHDGDSFPILSSKKYYYQDIENYRIIVLDTSNGKKMSDTQRNWLKTTLNTDKIKIVAMHHCIWGKDNLTDLEDEWKNLKPIFEKYKVKYVFSGHKHDSKVSRKVNGVTYRSFQALSLNGISRYVILTLN